MGWTEIVNDKNIVTFLLLFFRFTALFISAPIFSHKNIPMQVKSSLSFFFTIVFFQSAPELTIEITVASIVVAILSEFLFGLVIGLILQLAFNVITFAGGIISFMMGFSMASAIDPQSGVNMPIISQFLSLIGLMVLFALDLHHWLLLFIDDSLKNIPLGGFLMQEDLFHYVISASSNMLLVGYMMAFPIIALTLLQDVIFGMLMKTMPQFNLLVIGFPIKIMFAFGVIIATLTATMLILKNQMLEAFNALAMFF
jgi:flagellar biosynthetic protein FliR